MILIADGGSTKVDWIALDNAKKELFRTRTKGLNPAILTADKLQARTMANDALIEHKANIKEVHFYGAGCGTSLPSALLKGVLESIFSNATVTVKEDMMAAVYASSKGKEAIVCILGTGSNSCYFDGTKVYLNAESLGYILMDEASGNYFGKRLLVDYFYKTMPKKLMDKFESTYDVSADTVKQNIYKEESPNAYLGDFATFMFANKENKYINTIIEEGFTVFFERRILPYKKDTNIPIYFIGSIAYFFEDLLQKVAHGFGLNVTGVLRRPIDDLVEYHQKS